MEITTDVSIFILLLGLTSILSGYFLYARPVLLQCSEPQIIYGPSEAIIEGPQPFDGLGRLHWIRRKIPGTRSGRRSADGEEDSFFIMRILTFS
jgi:hypothetical protein